MSEAPDKGPAGCFRMFYQQIHCQFGLSGKEIRETITPRGREPDDNTTQLQTSAKLCERVRITPEVVPQA